MFTDYLGYRVIINKYDVRIIEQLDSKLAGCDLLQFTFKDGELYDVDVCVKDTEAILRAFSTVHIADKPSSSIGWGGSRF